MYGTLSTPSPSHARRSAGLTLAALGVVFGDIGTSPLYAFKEAFGGHRALAVTEGHVLGVLAMIFWAVTLIVSIKYLLFVLRFDNKGEGGVLALLAYAGRLTRKHRGMHLFTSIIAIFAASLFFGDAVITPAISVLSAVEGLSVVTPAFEAWTGTLSDLPRGAADRSSDAPGTIVIGEVVKVGALLAAEMSRFSEEAAVDAQVVHAGARG